MALITDLQSVVVRSQSDETERQLKLKVGKLEQNHLSKEWKDINPVTATDQKFLAPCKKAKNVRI